MNTKSFLRFLVIGGLLGGALTTWIAPGAITWYFKPPAQVEFSCAGPIEWALGRLRLLQGIGIGVGAILGLITFFLTRKRSRTATAPY